MADQPNLVGRTHQPHLSECSPADGDAFFPWTMKAWQQPRQPCPSST